MSEKKRPARTLPETFPEAIKAKPEVEMLPPREYGKTRDKVAAAVGLGSGRTYDKAAKVWEAAKKGDLPRITSPGRL